MLRAADTSPRASRRTAPSSRTTVTSAPIGSVSAGGSLIEGPGKAKVRKP